MKFKEITTKSLAALKKDLTDLQHQANSLVVKNRLGQVKNTHQLKSVRKDIARVLTALTQKA